MEAVEPRWPAPIGKPIVAGRDFRRLPLSWGRGPEPPRRGTFLTGSTEWVRSGLYLKVASSSSPLSFFLCVWKFKFSKREHRYDDQGGDGSRCPDDLIPFSSLGSGTNCLCFFVSRFVRLCVSVKPKGGQNLCLRNFKGDTVLHCSFATSLMLFWMLTVIWWNPGSCSCNFFRSSAACYRCVASKPFDRNVSFIRVIRIFRFQVLLEHTLLESVQYYRYISTIYCLLYVSNYIFTTHT